MFENKNKKIQTIFSEVPKTYELVNHLLTFGFDIVWRKKAAKLASKAGGIHWLDVCTGTGEMAAYLATRAPESTQVYALDLTFAMLREAIEKKSPRGIRFSIGDVKQLPFPDASFDLITISFATRNINLSRDVLRDTFAEFHRILKPGGRFVNLETSQPGNRMIRRFYFAFIRVFVQRIGTRISGSRAGYAYLANTIPRFYDAEMLKEILKDAGFASVKIKKLLLGTAAIHLCFVNEGTK